MLKTKQEIINLANYIRTETDNLPEVNGFGESNEDSIEEMSEIYRDLYLAAGGNKPENIEVRNWINGEPSELDDYTHA
jgi:hypothetical protein